MFGSAVLEVAIGLVFVYVVFSLIGITTPTWSHPMKTLLLTTSILPLLLPWLVAAADDSADRYLKARPEVVEAWQDMRFGMFNCWGPVSLTGLEIGWSRGAPRGGEFRVREGQGPTPVEVYDNLYKKWKPDRFDARQWVQVAKDAGQKYMIFLELVGGTHVMADVNMPSGESFVRQILYGKRYYRDKLGVDVTVGWQLDTFGHHAQMPQLMKLAGYRSILQGTYSSRIELKQ